MPTFEDNVGILYKTKHFQTSEYLAVGNHTKVFRISDYDGNKAMCVFNVVVVSKGRANILVLDLLLVCKHLPRSNVTQY